MSSLTEYEKLTKILDPPLKSHHNLSQRRNLKKGISYILLYQKAKSIWRT